MSGDQLTILPFLFKINRFIINPLLLVLFAVAFLIFFYGLFEFMRDAGDAAGREAGKRKILWGLVGMFIMFSAYGIIKLILDTFGLDNPDYLFK